jgi:PEP-CTERM motif-containing protein
MNQKTGLDPTRTAPRRRPLVPLTEGTEKRLLAYLASAGAGLAIMAPAAGATPLTPIYQHIDWNTDTLFDVNMDGTDDLVFTHSQTSWFSTSYSWGSGATLRVAGINKGLIASSSWNGSALRMSASNYVSSKKLSFGGSSLKKGLGLARVSSGSSYWGTQPSPFSYRGGAFTDKKNSFVSGFLGVQVAATDGPHFGFVRLEVVSILPNYIDAYITGFGYEPGVGAKAHIPDDSQIPEPSSLSLLGLGIAGLALWRRRKARQSEAEQS